MTNFNAQETVNSLVKIAQDMVGLTNEHAQEKASPEEVLAGLEQVISELTAIAQAVPAEQTAPTDEPAQETAAPSEEKPLEARLRESNVKIAELTEKINSQERVKLAEEQASLYPDAIKTAKYDEILKSAKTNEQIRTETDAIRQFNEVNATSQKSGKYSGFQSLTKTAKQEERLYIL